MKRLVLTALIAFLFRQYVEGQNMVLNPGLESYITCPGFGQFSNSYINDWDKPSWGSTDYYHYNCPGIIPSQQIPRTGDAYAGIIAYNYGQEYREYMTGTLTAPLIPGATYYCEFYVSLNDGYIQAVKEIGAYFSAAAPGPFANSLHIPVTPQVENTINLLDDTSMWTRVSGYFLAAGGEQYITIGNFNTDSNTTIVQVGSVGSFGSYYFVDDVWLSLAEGTSVSEKEKSAIHVFPNPVNDKLFVELSALERKSENIQMNFYNIVGKKVFESPFSPDHFTDVSHLPSGIYFIEMNCDGIRIVEKFAKQ